MPDDLDVAVESIELIDHHVHGAYAAGPDRVGFEAALSEGSTDPVPDWMTPFDSQLGFAIRRWCAPVLDLEPHAEPDAYWTRRTELGNSEVTRRFLTAAGVSDWLIDTGYGADVITDVPTTAAFSGRRAHEIVRLESLAEQLLAAGVLPSDYPDAYRDLLTRSTRNAVGVKTVLAYRIGFDGDLSRPATREVVDAAARWGTASSSRLDDPVLIRHALWAAVDHGLPIQFHSGFGDRDLDLHRVDPLLLTGFLRDPAVQQVPVMLLHCYPYQRNAGYLAQAFAGVYFDVGLALNYVGARAAAVVAESLELAPFAKQLYSSDAWGPPELHYLGSVQWRRAMTKVVTEWVADGSWSGDDAVRVATMIGRDNARRVYQLD